MSGMSALYLLPTGVTTRTWMCYGIKEGHDRIMSVTIQVVRAIAKSSREAHDSGSVIIGTTARRFVLHERAAESGSAADRDH